MDGQFKPVLNSPLLPATTSIQLVVNIDNAWIPVLTIPVVECDRFAGKPLKWLRLLGYMIYGQGDISTGIFRFMLA
jgi:hypothetical protein